VLLGTRVNSDKSPKAPQDDQSKRSGVDRRSQKDEAKFENLGSSREIQMKQKRVMPYIARTVKCLYMRWLHSYQILEALSTGVGVMLRTYWREYHGKLVSNVSSRQRRRGNARPTRDHSSRWGMSRPGRGTKDRGAKYKKELIACTLSTPSRSAALFPKKHR
jgi:hypothetical protein